MAKVYYRKDGTSYTMLQIQLKISERNRLRILCAELGISMQEFIKRLLRNQFPGIISPLKQPPKYRDMIGGDDK